MDLNENNVSGQPITPETAPEKKAKKSSVFGAGYLSFFCMELYLSVKAGVPVDEGIGMLRDYEKDKHTAAILGGVYDTMSLGEELNTALRESGAFPDYVVDMIEIGERTGHLESTLKALSDYYERQEQISKSVKSAVLYPALLLATMLVVIIVLITQVLPIFNNVLGQLGSEMTGFPLVLLNIGLWLRKWWLPVVLGLIVVIGAAAFWLTRPKQRDRFADFGFIRGIGSNIACSRFAAAMAMTMESGMDVDDSVAMAERLTRNPAMLAKIAVMREHMNAGESFVDAIQVSGVFPERYARMLSVAFKAGAADSAMSEIARRTGDEAEESIERLIARVEPTLVIVMTVIVGLILLSVMLPLMGIMNGMGA